MAKPQAQVERDRFGGRVREHRLGRGWSQVELAGKAGVSYSTVQRLEAGRFHPAMSTVKGLAKALGVKVDELLNGWVQGDGDG